MVVKKTLKPIKKPKVAPPKKMAKKVVAKPSKPTVKVVTVARTPGPTRIVTERVKIAEPLRPLSHAKKLTKKELDQFKELLVEERRKIHRHLENLSETSNEDLQPIATGDQADIANLEISQAALQKIGKRETYLLKKIELALGKIDDGTYGDCENCGEPIGAGRLLARPVAQLCIDCKQEQETIERKFSNRDDASGDDEDAEGTEEGEGEE